MFEGDPITHTRLTDQLISLLAPPLCAACGERRSLAEVICERCERELATAPKVVEPGPGGIHLVASVAPFEGVPRWIVHGLKYGRRLSLARVAADAMLRVLPDVVPAGSRREADEAALALVPVPPAAWRWRWRGFDPAEEIALALARTSGIPVEPCLRRRGGRRQVGRIRSQRLSDPPRIKLDGAAPASALLVDDVWTTGSTISACGRALRSGGCRHVVAVTFARTL